MRRGIGELTIDVRPGGLTGRPESASVTSKPPECAGSLEVIETVTVLPPLSTTKPLCPLLVPMLFEICESRCDASNPPTTGWDVAPADLVPAIASGTRFTDNDRPMASRKRGALVSAARDPDTAKS